MKYTHKESATLEFKRNIPDKKKTMLKTVIGFANTYGGEIIIGVDDSRNIIGVPEGKVDQMIDDLTKSIYDVVAPSIYPSIYTKRVAEKLLIIIDIAEGANKPYHFSSERISTSTYVRLGAHTVIATPDIIHELQWLKQRKFLDEMPVHAAHTNEINLSHFKKFLEQRKQKSTLIDVDEMLFHYNIITKDKGRTHPTVGGLLLFGKHPEKFFPEAFTICAHFSGTSGRDAIATRDSIGNLFQQYKDCIAFITSRLNSSYKIHGTGTREEQLEIPPEAIREVVINAIVHRNYNVPGPTKILIYDDRVDIISPGNFPGPIMADRINIGITYIRNSIITRVFRDIGIIEKLGSGLMTVFESYAKRHLPSPIITEGTGFVKCTLPRPRVEQQNISNHTNDKIFELMTTKSEIQTQDVASYMSISRATANRVLKKLTEQGLLERIGKGPATRYRKR